MSIIINNTLKRVVVVRDTHRFSGLFSSLDLSVKHRDSVGFKLKEELKRQKTCKINQAKRNTSTCDFETVLLLRKFLLQVNKSLELINGRKQFVV